MSDCSYKDYSTSLVIPLLYIDMPTFPYVCGNIGIGIQVDRTVLTRCK